MDEKNNINRVILSFVNKKILVVGDVMLDWYVFGEVERISPEAPIPILKKTSEKFVPGGAGNVAYNLASLGATVVIVGLVGNDQSKDILIKLFKEKKINTHLYTHNTSSTILKQRFVVKNQQLFRVDQEVPFHLNSKEENVLLTLIKKEIKSCDGMIFSDYAKGFFTKSLVRKLLKFAKISKKLVVVDIKPKNKNLFRGVDLITPNLKEAYEMTRENDVYKAGKALVKYYKTDIVITRSEEGLTIFKKNGSYIDIPAKKIALADVSGAGDTTVAVLTLSLVSGLTLDEAGMLANYAGGIVVQKPGTATVMREELESVVQKEHHLEEVEIVPKLWGYEKWLENNEKYCSKLLSLKKGYQCSLHYHKIKDEMFLVTKGHVRLELGKRVIHMREGNFVRIPPRALHRFRGIEDSDILEISTHHSEEDSYRLEESRKVTGSEMEV